MTINNEDIKKARGVIYRATLPDSTRKTLYELIKSDISSFVISSFEAYRGQRIEAIHFAEVKELMDNCKEKSYFREIYDAVGGEMFSELSEPYLSGWNLG